MSAIVASFVYNTANRDALLPRKPLPKPQPPPAQQQPANPPAATPSTGAAAAAR